MYLSTNNFIPKTGSEMEWNAAHRRLEDYLRALHITDKEQQDRIIPRVLESAAIKHAGNPGLCPTALAMEEIRAALDRWLQQILPSRQRGSVRGLISLFAIDAPEKWPASFLAEEIPPDFQCGLLECQVLPVPDLRVGSMVPEPFASPLPGIIRLPDFLGKLARHLAPLVMKGTASVLSAFSNPP